MTFAERHTELTTTLNLTDRLLAGHCLSARNKDELRKIRADVIEERETLMQAIELGVVDDSEGI